MTVYVQGGEMPGETVAFVKDCDGVFEAVAHSAPAKRYTIGLYKELGSAVAACEADRATLGRDAGPHPWLYEVTLHALKD